MSWAVKVSFSQKEWRGAHTHEVTACMWLKEICGGGEGGGDNDTTDNCQMR